MKYRAIHAVGAALLLMAIGGCTGSEPTYETPPHLQKGRDLALSPCHIQRVINGNPEKHSPDKFTIEPATAELAPGDAGLQLVVSRVSPTGAVRDLTTAASWRAEPAGIVTVSPTGYVQPTGAGKVTIEGHLPGSSVPIRASLTVAEPGGRTWNFAEDIEPQLTRLGCNVGGCHGRLDGQNGFHLSLFGYDAEGDYRAITRDAGSRRINAFRPEASLFLTKATGSVPHGGGMKLVPGSDAYRTMLGWLKAGAPLASAQNHGRMTRLEVVPSSTRLEEPGPRQLRVVAHFGDGQTRDVTRLASFKTNDDSTATISTEGKADLLRRGEADLVIRYESQVVSARISAVVNPGLVHDFAKDTRQNFIDDEVLRRLESLGVPPSPPSDDATYLRRVSLDLTGEQPNPDQVRDFLKDTNPNKRQELVGRLVGSADFIRFWQIKFGDHLEITQARPELGNAAVLYQTWLQKQLFKNRPWDEMVRTLLTAIGDPTDRESGGPVAYALEAADPKVAAEKTAQRFLGLRLRCAQCHDHPFDVWTQDDYFGLAATFAKVERSGGRMMGMMNNRYVIQVNADGQIENPRTHQPAPTKILGGPVITTDGDEDPRVKLAAWVTSPDNPFFARAMANWVWAQFFGRGIAHPADDLSRANPPVHPELLDALAQHFVSHKYDLRDLITTIATSATYAATTAPVPGNETDSRLFSHQQPRPLTSHQMADALAQATDVVNRFRDKSAGTRAIEITDPTTPSMILEAFGRCSRINGCASVDTPALSLRQSLLVIGGDVIESKVMHPQGYLSNLLDLSPAPDEVVENLYLRALCRMPNAEELSHWTTQLSQATTFREAAEDLFWALLNSREFAFNH